MAWAGKVETFFFLFFLNTHFYNSAISHTLKYELGDVLSMIVRVWVSKLVKSLHIAEGNNWTKRLNL